MYSDMSTRIRAFSSPKRYSASARASSVLPTPVGPRNTKEPTGRLASLRPARERRMARARSEEHTSELQSRPHLVCRLLLEKKKTGKLTRTHPPHSRHRHTT